MPTTDQEKPAAKPRQRGRKTDQKSDQRNQKNDVQASKPDQAPVAAFTAPKETAPVAVPVVETAVEVSSSDIALSGELLPPDGGRPAFPAIGPFVLVQAYSDYGRRSWQAGRFLLERLAGARSFEEAVEIHGEFAKLSYANFIAHSREICELYGELAKPFFRPFDASANGWTRIAR